MAYQPNINLTFKKMGVAGTAFAMLVQSLLPGFGAGVAHAQENGVRLPDYSNAQYLGQQKYDMFPEILGNETTVDGYLLDATTMLSVYKLPNGKVFGFMTAKRDGTQKWHWDRTYDGVFEQTTEDFEIHRPSYGYK